ncbi:hypothetical protein DXG01_003593 [Tephrocybe rancida]|nr:hypothetical protein DXG01_003593 [Tephrocybe rancida]
MRSMTVALKKRFTFDMSAAACTFGYLRSGILLTWHLVQNTALVKDLLTADTEHGNELQHKERDEESEYSDSKNGEADMVLIDTIDALQLADAVWSETVDDDKYLYYN